jgi:hypothetical protein
MNPINDTSSQSTITNLNNVVGVFNYYITSNELYTNFYTKTQTNNLLILKQDVLTASTTLLGNGGSITAINWNNITTNKPTNFQADWTTTVINKPTTFNPDLTNVYTKTEVNNITTLTNFYNKTTADALYQPILTFNSPMTKTGNIVTIDLSSYATTALLTSNSNLLQGNINLKENALTFSSPLTRTTNTIGINLSGYATTTNLASYLPLAGGQMTGNIGFGIAPSASILINCSNANATAFQNIQMINNANDFFYFGIAGNAAANSNYINNFFIQASKGLVLNSMNKTHTGVPDFIINNNSVGINTTTPNITYKLDVNGNINGLILYEGGVSLASKYTTSASLTNYVLKAGDTMSGALTVNGNINITGSGTNSLIFDNAYNLKKIQLNNNAGFGAGNADLTFYSAGTFTFRNTALSTTLFSVDDSGSLSFNGRLFPGKGLYTDNVLISTSNISANSFIEGGVSLASKYLTSASLDTTYLRLNGANTMTGDLFFNKTNLDIRLTPTNGNNIAIPSTAGFFSTSAVANDMVIRSLQKLILQSGGGNGAVIINTNNNVGIGNSAPTSKLCINPNPVYGGVFDFTTCPCIITNPTPSGTSILNDPQPVLHLCREGTLLQSYGQRISFYLSRYENNALNSRTRCDIVLAENEFLNRTIMTLFSNGNVGIGTINPTSKLCINPNPVHSGVFNFAACPCIITNPTPSSTTVLNDPQPVLHLCREGTNGQTYGQRISFYLSRYENNGINSRSRCDITLAEADFLNKTVITLLSSGNVNISDSLSINGNQIFNYLFNNTGANHGDINDFNNVTTFGYKFILGPTNGPSVPLGPNNQFYSWFIGLGINYPASGASSYGCQFAIPRDLANPTLSIRFKENNVWRSWTDITSRVLNGTARFTVDVWHTSSDNQQRLYFQSNSTTYIQGQSTTPIVFRNNANSDIAVIDSNGKMTLKTINISGFDGITLRIDGVNNYWNIFTGTSPTTLKTNSLIFFHGASGIASNWWLDGTQTNTNADISDKRSKYNIEDFTALETIEKLKPKSFDVIDDKDVKFQYGFIAQDIEEIPELKKLVFTEPDYIANINSYGKRTNDDGCCIITANDDLTNKIEVGDELKFVSDNKDKDNQEFVLDATPYHNRYKRRYAKVTEIISPTEFKVDCEINNLCCNHDNEFLIYGKKVEDAKSLDYNSFIALNTKAIQELYKIIQQQQETIDKLLSHITLE